VGTPEQVAESLMAYYELGITTFLIRGFDPLDDAIDYGRELIPLVRHGGASRTNQPTSPFRDQFVIAPATKFGGIVNSLEKLLTYNPIRILVKKPTR
jgi:hypothetical protein